QQNQDGDSMGDVCDGETDGDGWGNPADNCYLPNPDQADGDGDGYGDVCDPGPNTPDAVLGYTVPIGDDPPKPLQPDSDEDGIPDACDGQDFGLATLSIDGS